MCLLEICSHASLCTQSSYRLVCRGAWCAFSFTYCRSCFPLSHRAHEDQWYRWLIPIPRRARNKPARRAHIASCVLPDSTDLLWESGQTRQFLCHCVNGFMLRPCGSKSYDTFMRPTAVFAAPPFFNAAANNGLSHARLQRERADLPAGRADGGQGIRCRPSSS